MGKAKGLYIHIPFCKRKCRYCDFVSFTDCERYFDTYIDAVISECKEYKGEKIDSVFIGGGTPTILSSNQLKRLTDSIKDIFIIEQNCEFSIESNPKTLDKDKLLVLKDAGVNRISVGVQSFNDWELSKIGRIHNSKEAVNAIELIKSIGVFDVNVDIMMAIPDQTSESLSETLKTAVSLDPEHISCYSLIIEEGTPIYDDYQNKKFMPFDDEEDRKMYHSAVDLLEKNGYNRYEISNFSKEGKQCRHNLKYWNCDEYIGVGVSAHSYIDGIRYFNTSDLEEYLNGKYHDDEKDILSEKDKISEYIIMRLRLKEGINEVEFKRRFKVGFYETFPEKTQRLINLGLMEKCNENYRLTERGNDLSNTCMCEYV